jgi:hypothetical protein
MIIAESFIIKPSVRLSGKIKIVLKSYIRVQRKPKNKDSFCGKPMNHIVTIVLLSILMVPFSSHANEWFLMSRHGACSNIDALERKVGDITDVETPDDFIKLILQKGYDVKVFEPPNLQGNAVNVEVPAKELFIMFVTKELCKDFTQK